MLDCQWLRRNPDSVAAVLARRGGGDTAAFMDLLVLDARRRDLVHEEEKLKASLNQASKRVGLLVRGGLEGESESARAEIRALTLRTKELAAMRKAADVEFDALASRIPNLPHATVPEGKGDEDNVEVRRWGSPPKFDFVPRPHWEIGEDLGILDLDRASKLSGSRFALYRGLGARLERAIANLMLDIHTTESGYTEILPPTVANTATLYGTGNLPKFAGELYHLDDTDLWLIPTAEVPLTCLYRDEILPAEALPIRMTAWTSCFRREAGSYGKDVRGIIRQHQFQKVELVKIVHPDTSYDELETLVGDAEKVLQRLGLHYRVVLLCTGDIGFASAKTYDIEVWLPSENRFREISSCSNCEAFQARRANLRYRPSPDARPEFVHTLNGSGVAIGRTWLAVVENYQQADGSVVIPDALRPYLAGLERITAGRTL